MRVQTNALPPHCYSTPSTVTETKYDIKFVFNPMTTTTRTFTSQSAFDSVACLPNKTSVVPTESYFTNMNTAVGVTTLAGITINGVVILSSASADYVDPFYPQTWSGATSVTAESVDTCIAHPQGSGVYHYHFLPSCLYGTPTTGSCASNTACTSNLKTFALDTFSSKKTQTVVGIARDGHLIMGPYDSTGSVFDCASLDQCGGKYLTDTAKSYVYVFSNTFPYTMNCFGPSSTLKYKASCSTNTCTSTSSTSLLQQ